MKNKKMKWGKKKKEKKKGWYWLKKGRFLLWEIKIKKVEDIYG